MSFISALTQASSKVSIIFFPLTKTKGFGVLRVIGTKREPKPAARNIALLTLYGSNTFNPLSVIKLFESIIFLHIKFTIILLTVPKDKLVNSEIFL